VKVLTESCSSWYFFLLGIAYCSPNFAGGMQTPWRSRAEQEGGSDLTLSVVMMANTTMSRASVVDAKASACGASCWRSFFEPKDTEGSDWS